MILKNKGPYFVLLAALLWSSGGVLMKYIPWSPISINCLRSIIAAVVMGLFNRKWKVTLTRSTLLAALCLALTTTLFIMANKMTTAANAVVLQYSAPVHVILLTIIVLKARPKALDIVTVLIAFSGISLFFFDHLGHGALLGDLIALLSGVTFAGVFFFNSLPDANPAEASYLGCLLNCLFIPFLFFDDALFTTGALPWLFILLLGVFQLGLAYVAFSKGIKLTPPVSGVIIAVIEPILNPIWVFLLVGERPGVLSIAGAGIVICAIAGYNVLNTRAAERRLREETFPEAEKMVP